MTANADCYPMKIAIIAPCPPPYGGISRVVENHLSLWPPDRVEAHFVPIYSPPEPEPPDGATFADLSSGATGGSMLRRVRYGAMLAKLMPITRP
ncbi:hypothetical protein FIL92_01230, partial [SAR202 cluster bacterium AD-812-D07_MRT_10900m]|nr:hypothetical protein [SAR202 cluster bacterium AD-812-D07_MRT_10900m]